MIIKRISFLTLVFVCLCATTKQSLGEPVIALPDGLEFTGRLVINTKTGRHVPVSEIGLGIADGPAAKPIVHNPFSSATTGAGVVSIMNIGDSIGAGARIFSNRAREGWRPFLWRDIHVSGPAEITSGAVNVDFRGELAGSGTFFWGDAGGDSLTGPNPVLSNTHNPYMGPNNGFGIPAFDDDNQAGRGLSVGDFLCVPDCSSGLAGSNGFDQTDVPGFGNAAKWVADQSPVDIAVIMLGANDILNQENFVGEFTPGLATAVANRLIDIVDELEKANSDVSVFVSQVPSQWIECATGLQFCTNNTPGTNNWVPRFGDDDVAQGDHNEVVSLNDALNTAINNLGASYDVTLVDIDATGTAWKPDNNVETRMEADEGGVHPSTTGDEFIATRMFSAMEQTLTNKAQQAVPEPSSFLFLGLVGLVAGGWKYARRGRNNKA